MPWPHQSQAKWTKRGDRSGIELKLFFSHPEELNRAVQRLQQVSEAFENDLQAQEIWMLP